mgnify:CR=1 FL=1
MSVFLACTVWVALTYVIGAVPFGLIVARVWCGEDPRESGSHNTGATNVARICGLRYGLATFFLDLAKGFVPLLLGMALSHSAFFLSLTGLAAILGHMYSVFLNWKGGKGVATTIGVFAVLTPTPFFWSLVACLFCIWLTRTISAGSLALSLILPVFILLSGAVAYLPLSLVVLVLIYHKHRENILRLAKGEEHSWREKTAS